ncbi:MAG TPA: asparagine synthase (glutamine-hydrolyzing) [Solirubrobacterales bacterium]|nr:asparagine synthase (glutamine-hydrolyzing) [Solirubrobacterales bacterium]
MCGIAAIVDAREPLPESSAAAMVSALRHRGPDGESVERIGPTTLIHTRLAIIDVAGGHQPMHSEDGSCSAVVNGEIYNHLDLRRELEAAGHRFATRSDSEVIVHAYEEWGPDCVRRLNGMFAFALWDARRERLLAARDPFGVKPLYWLRSGGRTAVASEIGAFLAGGLISAEIDRIALEHYLAWRFTPAPRTIFKGISKLPPASLLVAESSGTRVVSYREPPGEPFESPDVGELAEELGARFEAAVERQMMSDVPYGAFLSGGVDSAAIAAAMRRKVSEHPLTFTIGFPGHDQELDEREAAAQTASAIGTRHHSTAMEELDFPGEVAACVRRLEEPIGSASAPAALQLSRFAAQHVKVVLSGQGADEPFGGYERHQAAAALPLTRLMPRSLARPVMGLAEALPRNERIKRAARLLDAPAGLDRLLRVFEISDSTTRSLLTHGPAAEAAEERRELAAALLQDLAPRKDPLEQALYLDTRMFLPDCLLLYGDKTSMAASLEQRVPFLDVELMAFVERIPARLRLRGLKRKWLYRRAISELVPDAALQRRKHPFATPYDEWLRSALGEEVKRLYRSSDGLADLIDPGVVDKVSDEHRRGRIDHKRLLYCLLEFAYWHLSFIQGEAPASPGFASNLRVEAKPE